MGTATKADSVIVRWLSGTVDKYYNVAGNTLLMSTEGTAVPLPLSLIQFKGEKTERNTIQLNWSTADELDFKGFEIERSTSGLSYESIYFEPARGTGANIESYSFKDENLPHGKRYYYRLKCLI